ncbi:MAG: hypothetical protein GX240_04070 [Candidatus Atribacteria bacterium]|jgi:hypothetical protein|nr:hypothetical protein [Candidatus Atribacteria bacterium]
MFIITLTYRLIILFFTTLVILDMFKEEDIWNQLTSVFVIIPFVLRLFMIK